MRSIDDLRQIVRTTPDIDDLVAAVIFKSQQKNIPKTRAFFQIAFFVLQKTYPQLFDQFIFDESGMTPFSDELDSVMFRLEASTILSTLNPTYKSYAVISSSESLEESYNKFDLETKRTIDLGAELFSKLVNTKE